MSPNRKFVNSSSNGSAPAPTRRQRFATLERIDPESADYIRKALFSRAADKRKAGSPNAASRHVKIWAKKERDADIVIIPGTGSVGEISALLTCPSDKSRILLLERDPARAAHLFAEVPIEELVGEGRLALAFGEDEALLETRMLQIMDIPKGPVIRLFQPGGVPPEDAEFYGAALLRLRARMRTKIFNMGTLVQHGCRWQHNTLLNLPALLTNPGIDRLAGIFEGAPALVIGAGPSLSDALPTLAAVADRYVVISTGTALNPLRAAGVTPDIVVSVDASHKIGSQFEANCEDLFLACSSITHPPVIPGFRGIFSGHVNANPVGVWAGSLGDTKGCILGAGTVTATAMDLAARMGCNPVTTLGLDLSMAADGRTHANNSMYHGKRHDARVLHEVPGNYSDTVLTTNQFHVYIDAISGYVKSRPETRFINANDAGALIEGMHLVKHDHIATQGAREPVNAYDTIAAIHAAFEPSGLGEAAQEMERVAEDLAGITRASIRAAMLCNRLTMALRRARDENTRRECNDFLNSLTVIDQELLAARESSLLIDMALRGVYYTQQGNPESHEAGLSEQSQANHRSRTLYEQVAGAAGWTRDLLLKAAADLEKSPEAKGDEYMDDEYAFELRKTA